MCTSPWCNGSADLLNKPSDEAALALKLKLWKRGIGVYTYVMLGIHQREGELQLMNMNWWFKSFLARFV